MVEPLASYLTVRARRDLNEGRSSFGLIGTSTNRNLGSNETAIGRLHSNAFAGGVDFRHETANRMWSIAGEFTSSLVTGDTAAISRTQRASARYFQRPDASHVSYDPDATSLAGFAGQLDLSKQAGNWRGQVGLSATSPGYEVNDLGFQTNADRIQVNFSGGFDQIRPGDIFRRWSFRLMPGTSWNFAGETIERDIGIFGNAQFLSYHGISGRVGRSFPVVNDRLTRSGPLTEEPGAWSANVNYNTDTRRSLTFRNGVSGNRDDAGGWRLNINSSIGFRPTDALDIRVGPTFSRNHAVAQFVTSRADATATHTFGRRYIFARLDQTTLSMDARLAMTFSPTLTLEVYAEPFISSGNYGLPREFAARRTYDFREYGSEIGTLVTNADGSHTIDPDGNGPATSFTIEDQDFNFHSLLGNAVLRWEWRPGSTFFLVWQQARSERFTASPDRSAGRFDFDRDARDLFSLEPENILLVKFSYWLNR
jgi:hypothetical protein